MRHGHPSLAAWPVYQFGYKTVLWSVDAKDYEGAGVDEIISRLVEQTTAGSIILCHDIVPATTLEGLPEVLDRLLDRGHRFVTVGELRDTSDRLIGPTPSHPGREQRGTGASSPEPSRSRRRRGPHSRSGAL